MAKRKSGRGSSGAAGRASAFEAAMNLINKEHGDNTLMKMSESPLFDGDIIPTGSLAVDMALGVGGYPRGRIVEIYGPESSGKTTLALHAIAEVQKLTFRRYAEWEALPEKDRGEEPPKQANCVFIDMENALDPKRAAVLGVDVDNMYITQPDVGETALGIAGTVLNSQAADIVVIDSVSALVPRAELSGEFGDSHVGLQARMMSQALRMISGSVKQSNAVVIFINQIREMIGGMTFGPKTTTSGGRALKFYASVRLDVRRIQTIKQGGESVGNRVRVTVKKNKVAPPFKEAEFDLMFQDEGISRSGEIIDIGVGIGIIEKRGAFYRLSSNDTLLGQGRENSKEALRNDPELMYQLEQQIRNEFFLGNAHAPGGDYEDEDVEIQEEDSEGLDD